MISIVVPVYNEEESLKVFYTVISAQLKKLKKVYELVFIDDGSKDASLFQLKELAKNDGNIRIFSFRKNRGKAEALTLGFQKAKGDVIITLDADLQDKPSEIPVVLEQLTAGYDVVCGWRKDRKDTGRKIISSKIFNYLTNKFWGLKLHDYNCGLKGYTAEAAKSLQLYGGMHRFIPALAYQEGFSVTEVAVSHDERKYGKSKYGFSKIFKDVPDLFTMLFLTKYGHRPLHFFSIVAAPLFLIGFVILLYLTIIWIGGSPIGRRPLLFLGMLLISGGLQIFFTGFLADMILSASNKKDQNSQLRYSSEA